MTFRDEVIQAIKGKPGSLTSTAFNTGVTLERERIIKLLFVWGISTREENNWRDDAIALELIALIKGENK